MNFVSVKTLVARFLRFLHFLLRLWEAGFVLQPSGGEHYYLSSRRRGDPLGLASSRAPVPAVRNKIFSASFF